jgi:hypothetical protein
MSGKKTLSREDIARANQLIKNLEKEEASYEF